VAHTTLHARGAGERRAVAEAAGDAAAAIRVEGWGSVESLIVEPEFQLVCNRAFTDLRLGWRLTDTIRAPSRPVAKLAGMAIPLAGPVNP